MVKKYININQTNWDKLKLIKSDLKSRKNKNLSWNNIFEDILGNFDSSNTKEAPKPQKIQNPTINVPLPPIPLIPSSNKSIPQIKLTIPTPTVKNPGINTNSIQNELIESDMDLNIPLPPKKKPIQLSSDMQMLSDLAKKDTPETKYILIECPICGEKPIMMPVPKKYVLESKEPVVDVSYIHGNPKHSIVAQLDHDFQVRRRRASQIVFE